MKKINFKLLFNYFSSSLLTKGKKKKTSFLFKNFQYNKNNKNYFKHIFLLFFIVYKIRPLLEIQQVKKGSKNYLVPTPFRKSNQSIKYGINQIVKNIRLRREYLLETRTKNAFNSVLKREGPIWNSLRTYHYIAAKNIYHSNYRWK